MIYRLILALRHLAYNKGWKKSFKAEVPTICVGNITVGGTGKTPHTEMILRKLLDSDRWGYSNIAVLSRGYKRKSKGFQIVDRESTPYCTPNGAAPESDDIALCVQYITQRYK